MTEQTQPTDAPLNSIELMKVVMQADEETRAFALRGTTNWAAHIGKAVQNAVLAKWGTPAGAGEPVGKAMSLPGISGFTQACFHSDVVPLGTKLYTAPQPTQAQAGAVPLTDEWIRSKCKEPWIFETAKQWIRIAESAHGIKGADHG